MKTKKKVARDLYQEVTDKIVAALEGGVAPWVRPWSVNPTGGSDRNGESGRPYNGINILLTAFESMMHGYTSREWFTFNQVRKLGGHVQKGQHGLILVFWKPLKIRETDEATGEMKDKKIPLMRSFVVFNRDQCADLPLAAPVEVRESEWIRDVEIEGWVDGLPGLDLRPDSRDGRAFYSPDFDFIGMPSEMDFESMEAYYATLFHEITHWTGAKRRCAREMGTGFGGSGYAFEELVAELGSAFLCSHFSVNGSLQHSEYIGHWIKALKNDKRMIFTASARAREAAVYLGVGNDAEHEESEGAQSGEEAA